MSKAEFRGKTFDRRTVKMLIEVDRLVGPNVPIVPTQGSYSTSVSASGGTHAGGGAVDLSIKGMTPAQIICVVWTLRQVGFAAWFRPALKDKWPAHLHLIAIDCPDLSGSAKSQVEQYRKGTNGLADRKPDPHKDLELPVVNWETYLQARKYAA